jgi:hypothetical protein
LTTGTAIFPFHLLIHMFVLLVYLHFTILLTARR